MVRIDRRGHHRLDPGTLVVRRFDRHDGRGGWKFRDPAIFLGLNVRRRLDVLLTVYCFQTPEQAVSVPLFPELHSAYLLWQTRNLSHRRSAGFLLSLVKKGEHSSRRFSTGVVHRFPVARSFNSIWPFLRFLSPTTTCSGIPSKSASLNLNPGVTLVLSSYTTAIFFSVNWCTLHRISPLLFPSLR